jgi:DNA-binding transcriptional LysR family regulator
MFVQMDTKKLSALITALDKGSLTAAAEEMGYTQSGLTHMMNSLEDELGIKILVRSKGGVRLSPAGRELLPQMQAVVDSAEELQRSVDKLLRRSFTVLRLGAYSSVSRQWLPAMLASLRRACPEIDVSITTGSMQDGYNAVKNGELDCAIVSYQPTLCQGLSWIQLHDDPLLAILPQGYDIHGGAFPVKQFDGREFLMPSDGMELDIVPAITPGNSRVNPEYRYTGLDDASIVSMVAHGLGVSVLSRLIMDGISDNVQAVPLLPSACRHLGIVVNEHLSHDKSIKSFVTCARETLAQIYGNAEE